MPYVLTVDQRDSRRNRDRVAEVLPRLAELGLAPGAEVWAAVKASEVAVYAR